MKLCILDTETTGLDSVKNGIIQISGMQVIDDVAKEPFDFRVRPFPEDVVEMSALRVNGVRLEDIMEPHGADVNVDQVREWCEKTPYRNPLTVKAELTRTLQRYVDPRNPSDKYLFLGYNAPFDWRMLYSWFEKCRDKYMGSFFWWPPIDVGALTLLALGDDRGKTPGKFRQTDAARILDIEVDETRTHDSAYDVDLCYRIYCEAMRRLRGAK